MTIKLFPATPKLSGDADPLPAGDVSRYRVAATRARRVLPGPLGELAQRELSAYAEFGYRFSDEGLMPRLAAVVLATPFDTARPDHSVDGSTGEE